MRILVTYFDGLKCNFDFYKIYEYCLNSGIEYIYIFSDNIIFSDIDDINKFIPSTNIKIFLFLSEKDRLKLCFDDVKQFNKTTKNINLILDNKLFYKDLVFLNYLCKFENVLENNFNNINYYNLFVTYGNKNEFKNIIKNKKNFIAVSKKDSALVIDLDNKLYKYLIIKDDIILESLFEN